MSIIGDVYRQHYFAELPLHDPEWEEATRLAAEYFLQTEAYDRTVCTGPVHPEVGILPTTLEERRLSYTYARELWARLSRIAAEKGIDPAVMVSARKHVGQWDNDEEILLGYACRPGPT